MIDQQRDDALAGIEVTSDFERFVQKNDIFSRAFWDDCVRTKQSDAFFVSYRMEAAPKRGDWFSSVIVLGHEMRGDLGATYPSALAGAATDRKRGQRQKPALWWQV